MVFLSLDLLRRGRSQASGDDIEQQRPAAEAQENQGGTAMRETAPANSQGGIFAVGRPALAAMFRGRTNASSQPALPNQQGQAGDEDAESPKTPRFTLGLPTMPSTRLHLPHLTRTWTNGSNGPASRPPTARRPSTSRGAEASSHPTRPRFPFFSRSPTTRSPTSASPTSPAIAQPAPVASSRSNHTRTSSGRPIDGADPSEVQLAEIVDEGRRRRNRRRDSGNRRRRGRREGPPRRFLFCFPWIKSRRVRSQILRCFVSGMFLTLLLSVYLALSITKNINNNEFTVLLILIILFTTIFFCHGLIRLCMLVVRPRPEDENPAQLPQMMGPSGYAVPRQPIRVVLARDEEAAGIESEATKIKPPAYGLWRESVRVDPNRLFWQRNDAAPAESSRRPESRASPRPPSYASDDGVTYVVEAAPRSTVPTTDVPLPPHPSERGRLNSARPAW